MTAASASLPTYFVVTDPCSRGLDADTDATGQRSTTAVDSTAR